MYISKLIINGYKIINEQRIFELNSNINIFIGKNATGKSTIFQAILNFLDYTIKNEDKLPNSLQIEITDCLEINEYFSLVYNKISNQKLLEIFKEFLASNDIFKICYRSYRRSLER